jgi:hypothetical protein
VAQRAHTVAQRAHTLAQKAHTPCVNTSPERTQYILLRRVPWTSFFMNFLSVLISYLTSPELTTLPALAGVRWGVGVGVTCLKYYKER